MNLFSLVNWLLIEKYKSFYATGVSKYGTFSRSLNTNLRDVWNWTLHFWSYNRPKIVAILITFTGRCSFHEMGLYDLPAAIDYVLEHTNRTQLYYIGHSMGTCMFYVMCSIRPEYNGKIRAQISLAPVAYVHHMKSVLNSLVPYANQIQVCEI